MDPLEGSDPDPRKKPAEARKREKRKDIILVL